MSRWQELFDNHPIHATLVWLRESASKEFEDVGENEVVEKRRFLKLISKFEEIFQSLDTELIPFNQLDSLNTALRNDNLTTQINAYAQNGKVGNLVKASNMLTNHLHVLSLLLSLGKNVPSLNPIKELEKLTDTATSLLVEKKNMLVKQLDELNLSIVEKDQKLVELSNQLTQNKKEIGSLVTEWQSQFSSAQETRSQEFSKWRDTFSSEKNTEVDGLIQKHDEKLEKDKTTFTKKVDDILSDGKEKHQAILDLYEITAGDSVGAGYLSQANKEKGQADNWRIISVTFIVLTVAWLLFAFFYNTSHILISSNTEINLNSQNEMSDSAEHSDVNIKDKMLDSQINKGINNKAASLPWYTLFVTFSLSGVLLWGSAYAAQQSTKHRNNEKRTRWFALEVKAIDPFISSLESDQRNELKKQLSERIFGQSANVTNDDAKVIDEHVFKMVADTLGKILSKIPR